MTDTITLADTPDARFPRVGADVRTRWEPARAGIVNVWRYADEVLHFHRGRLLLRGPNGSGKSMALELLLPFLLDANAAAHRMSSAQRSRGGLYDRMVGDAKDAGSPVGFLWLEFRRRDDDAGEVETCTIGVRLRASSSTRQVDKAWFVTPQRVGIDLELLDADRVPLAVAALGETLAAGGGHVYDDATTYRDRVRERLFPGTTESRYDAVITALLALRQEKLSQNLDLDRLSATLTSALPPLDPRDIADAAEGFRQLDQRRDNLAQLEVDRDTVTLVARRQRVYARTILRSAAAELIAAQTRRDGVVRALREATEALGQARARDAELREERRAIAARATELGGRIEALRQRDAYRQGESLEALRQEVGRAARAAEDADRRAADAHGRAAEAAAAAAEARAVVDQAGQQVTAAWHDVAAPADALRATATADAAAAATPDAAESLLRAWIDARAGEVATVRDRLADLDRVVRDREEQQRRVDDAEGLRERRVGDRDVRAGELDTAVAALRGALGRWRASLHHLPGDDLAGLDTVAVDELDGVDAGVQRAAAPLRDRLAARAGELAARDRELVNERTTTQERRDDLAGASEPELPAPAWRRDRRNVAGAPLWRLLDVVPDTPDELRDRIEAALHTAGLLDAWVAPDGSLALAGAASGATSEVAADVLAVTGRVVAGPSLADVLVAEPSDHVPVEVVRSLLDAVALVDTATTVPVDGPAAVVGRDGTFRFGTFAGSAPARPAGFIGATARERQRQRDLAALDAELARLDDERRGVADALVGVASDRAALEEEAAGLPSVAPAQQARTALAAAIARVADAEEAVDLAIHGLRDAEQHARAAQKSLAGAAADAQLPTTADGLDEVVAHLGQLDRRTTAWVARRRHHDAAAAHRDSLGATARFLAGQAEELTGAATAAASAHGDVCGRLDALESTVGVEYREVVALVEAAEAELGADAERDARLEDEKDRLGRTLGALEEKLTAAEADRDRADGARETARRRLAGLVRDGFAPDAGLAITLDDPDGVTAALEAARTVARELPDLAAEAAAVDRAQLAVNTAAHDAGRQLGGRADLTFAQTGDGWWLLRARADGVERSISQLEASLARELELARDELAEHERDLYDRTLTEGLRRHLVARIQEATGLTDRINRQLRQVRTGAGVGVQLDWVVDEPDGSTAVAAARPLLLKAPELLRPEEIETLHGFLRTRIDTVRTEEDGGDASWEARLTAAFDYRRWHRFVLRVSHQAWGGEFRPATSRRLAQLSTGERSVVLHLPMLASVAAHYDATVDGAPSVSPRLILLDELFVGVDPVNRAQLFGMFVEWDLDAVLTSDHEWCRYRELDGISIHQVHGDADPVVTTRFVWDGREQHAAGATAP